MSKDEGGVETGVIVGIIIGVILFLLVVGICVFLRVHDSASEEQRARATDRRNGRETNVHTGFLEAERNPSPAAVARTYTKTGGRRKSAKAHVPLPAANRRARDDALQATVAVPRNERPAWDVPRE
eukprot:GEMP01068839.1.p1 GENE.GEMP01068839.1~~GEMP01068839.1.p1  ORF type:complete len:139 (+),score=38.74 GEMP01068839.1:40-417(+)